MNKKESVACTNLSKQCATDIVRNCSNKNQRIISYLNENILQSKIDLGSGRLSARLVSTGNKSVIVFILLFYGKIIFILRNAILCFNLIIKNIYDVFISWWIVSLTRG